MASFFGAALDLDATGVSGAGLGPGHLVSVPLCSKATGVSVATLAIVLPLLRCHRCHGVSGVTCATGVFGFALVLGATLSSSITGATFVLGAPCSRCCW